MPAWRIRRAQEVVAAGGILAYPTEGVWGLGCRPDLPRALARLLRLKGRRPGKGLIVVAARWADLAAYVRLPPGWRERATWPGPVTWVLSARPGLSPLLTGGRRTLAVRVTAHPPLAALCALVGPLVSTSANRSGQPTVRGPDRLRLKLRLDGVLRAPLGGLSGPTEIRDGRTGALLRPGSAPIP